MFEDIETVRVNGHEIEVKVAPKSDLLSDTTLGCTNIEKNVITLPDGALSRQVAVLFHEIQHLWCLGHVSTYESLETVCQLTGEGLLSFIRDNWELLEEIHDALEADGYECELDIGDLDESGEPDDDSGRGGERQARKPRTGVHRWTVQRGSRK